jgi:DMSO/TMAO reductase YedYZ molybdopterin-dependent catalytic subunit
MRDQLLSRRNFLFGKPALPNAQPALLPFYNQDGYTPNAHFFRQQLRHVPPIIPVYWMLRLAGMVEKPLLVSYDDLLVLPKIEYACTIACNGGSARNPMIGNALWAGVPMSELFSRLTIAPQAQYAQLYAADGYTTFIDADVLANALLAYEMNGEPLPPEHGFPARLIVPGRAGYKMPKWIQRIEFTDEPRPGFWEARGWPDSGEIGAKAYLFSPHHQETLSGLIILAGAAYGGEQAVTTVEISIDDAPWMPVSIPTARPYRWSTWQLDWMPPSPGDYLVKVRAAHPIADERPTPGTIIHVTA